MAKCMFCKKDAAQVCSGCVNAPVFEDNIRPAHYCGSECQKADWSNHKAACKALKMRRQLYRAGEILQETFYMFWEKVFDKPIMEVDVKEDRIYLQYDDVYKTAVITAADLAKPFPSHMCPTSEVKNAVLTHLAGGDALGNLYEVTKCLLDGTASKVEELQFIMKNLKRTIVELSPSGKVISDYDYKYRNHDIWKGILKHSNETYALDITGAQFGYYAPVIPWDEYVASRVTMLDTNFLPFGNSHKELAGMKGKEFDIQLAMISTRHEAAIAVQKGMEQWVETVATVQLLLNYPPTLFQAKKKALIQTMGSFLSSFIAYRDMKLREKAAHMAAAAAI